MLLADRAIGGDAGKRVHLGGFAAHAALFGVIDQILHIHLDALLVVAAAVCNGVVRFRIRLR